MNNPNTNIQTVLGLCLGVICLWPVIVFIVASRIKNRFARQNGKLVHEKKSGNGLVTHTWTFTLIERLPAELTDEEDDAS